MRSSPRPPHLPPYKDPDPVLLLWRFNSCYQLELKRHLREFGLTYLQFALLQTLIYQANGMAVSQRELSEILSVRIPTANKALNGLVNLHLAWKLPFEVFDKRAYMVRATLLGFHIASLVEAQIEPLNERLKKEVGSGLMTALRAQPKPACPVPKARAAWWRQTHGPLHPRHL